MRLNHPTLTGIVTDVPDDQVADWQAAGWVTPGADEDPNRCPTCGATGDEPCRTKSGEVAEKPHAGRPE